MTAGLFPDVADVFCDLLARFGQTGLITPPNLGDVLPFIRSKTVGGSDDLVTDRTSVDVDVFAASMPAAVLLGEQIRQFLEAGPHIVDGAVIDFARTVARPRLLTDMTLQTGVFRCIATYRVSTRRSRT